MIYLDNAATTKPLPQVLNAMSWYLAEQYGNPGSSHQMGKAAASAIQSARGQTANFLGCSPEQVIFTSGGSEGNSTVFKGLRRKLLAAGKIHLVISALEHESVMKAVSSLVQEGFTASFLFPKDANGISPNQVEEAIRPNTGLVSVQYVNNETGVVHDVDAIGKICKAHSVLFHSDCVQAAGQYPIQAEKSGMDFAVVSAHKFHGPKGVGALYVRGPELLPLICGGSFQEQGLRGGTENTPGIVGMGTACELASKNRSPNLELASHLKQTFLTALSQALPPQHRAAVHLNVPSTPGKILSLRIDGVDGETLVLMADLYGLCISAGSACHSRETVPSLTLVSMGLSEEEAKSTVRISFSHLNTREEAQEAAETLAFCIQTLRG